jgi:hypothetical protein
MTHDQKADRDMVDSSLREIEAEKFGRWWAKHRIHQHGLTDAQLDSYHALAFAAWRQASGDIDRSHRDERIERLEERAQYLRNKIFNNRPAESARAKAELSALEWVIGVVLRVTKR